MVEMDQPVFRVEDLSVVYGGREIISIPRLELFSGKIYGIIGPSGSGKSSLLRVLNLLEKPMAGKLEFQGQPFLYRGKPKLAIQRQMTLVFQKPVLFSGTVLANVLYGLKIRGLKGPDLKKRAIEALTMVGMEGFTQAQAKTLSGGEAQRVALARAIVLNPRVLLLDEPTANLDPANVSIIEKIIDKINQDLGTTVILVTHNLFQAKRLAHEIIFLNQGQIIEQNLTGLIFEDPEKAATKAFLQGEMIY